MGFGSRVLMAGGLGVTAAFVVACGSSSGDAHGLLSEAQSATIAAELSTISGAVSAGDCRTVRAGVHELNATLSALPSTVNHKLLLDLGQGADTTGSLAQRDCRAAAEKSSSSSSSTSSTTPSTPTAVSHPTTPSTPTTVSHPTTPSTPQTTTQNTTPQVGSGTVTSLSSTTTNGGAGLTPGGGN